MSQEPSSLHRGFTLVEVLIVIVITSILAVFATQQYRKFLKRAAESYVQQNLTACLQELTMKYSENGSQNTINCSIKGCLENYTFTLFPNSTTLVSPSNCTFTYKNFTINCTIIPTASDASVMLVSCKAVQ